MTKLCGTRSLFDMAVSIADQFEILPTIPRRTGQINRAGHPADNPSQFWQRSMYYPFMDYYITEPTARLLENGPDGGLRRPPDPSPKFFDCT
jgi:hypothetical protein